MTTRGRVLWTIAVADVLVYLIAGLQTFDGGIAAIVLYLLGIASFAGVGALLGTRVPANPIGPLLLAAGTTLVLAIAIGTYADVGAQRVPPWPGAAAARVIGDTTFIYPFVLALICVPLVFPDGHLPSPRYRGVVWLIVAFLVTWTFSGLFFENGAGARIPAMAFLEPVVSVMEMIVLVATVITFGAAVVAQVNRFRRGDAILRQQVKWLAADVAIGAVVLPLALVLTDSNPGVASAMSVIGILAAFALPIVIAIAILRYRLFELDRIISRTLGWAIVTGMLVALFAGMVVLLQTVLAPIVRESTLAVAASTLAAFALFQPLRRRVQRTVDRRFDRARYDGQRLAATFAERLRSEVDLAVLESSLAATAGEAVRPTGAAVWLSARRAR